MRIPCYDWLRTIGLFLVILAHLPLAPWLFQLRNFDVPLLVFVSGLSYRESLERTYLAYVWHRFRRLVIPTWLFLTVFFIVSIFLRSPYPFSMDKILGSYALLYRPSINYVWIIKVFLVVALIAPFYKKLSSSVNYLWFLGVIYAAYELFFVGMRSPFFVSEYINYLLPYGVIFGLGLIWPQLPERRKLICLGCFAGVALMFYLNGAHSLQMWKYPPRLFYVSYGLAISVLLEILLRKVPEVRWIRWLSENSLTIYLVHIALLYIGKWYRIF